MDSRTGKKIRFGRLVDPASQRGVVVAYSHGVLLGPFPGGRTRSEIKQKLGHLKDADGIVLGPGVVSIYEDAFIGRDRPTLIVHADWENWDRPHMRPSRGAAQTIVDVELAAASGVDALMSYMFIGHDDTQLERLEIERNARLAQLCDKHGLVLIVEPRSVHELTDRKLAFSKETVSLYCRMAAELGADIIKCLWPGSEEVLAEAVNACPVPIFLAGGPAEGGHLSTFKLARTAVEAGCGGLIFGRRSFENEVIPQVIQGLKDIVQRDVTPEDAMKRFA
ncbi:class I fructose-bisphosphate aldolase [Acidisoma sp. S159]|uniref:class I fructose-bisphosphate aldolase n=1 Tax=Acidisoma sp. S159 TaxID=1747225 RepID=UPI00131CCA1C|nr:hypothetical protein [Acidisoma sp. S159]